MLETLKRNVCVFVFFYQSQKARGYNLLLFQINVIYTLHTSSE